MHPTFANCAGHCDILALHAIAQQPFLSSLALALTLMSAPLSFSIALSWVVIPPVQVRIMSTKMEADYKKAVEVEQQNRTKEQLLHSLDKIRSPISVCEITREATKILFANHTWAFLAGDYIFYSLFLVPAPWNHLLLSCVDVLCACANQLWCENSFSCQ